jgi:hypothetical protein
VFKTFFFPHTILEDKLPLRQVDVRTYFRRYEVLVRSLGDQGEAKFRCRKGMNSVRHILWVGKSLYILSKAGALSALSAAKPRRCG